MANTRITQGVIKPNEDYDVRHINATGIITATNLNLTGVLTYEDVTNVDSIGVITARKGIVSSGVVTATAFHGDGSQLTGIDATALKDDGGNVKIQAQDSGAVHTGISTFDTIKVGSGVTIESNGQATFTGIVTFGSGSTTIDNNVINVGTALTLGHTQGVQFHTQNLHADGFEINQINASGIITASEFRGSGANLSNLPAGLGTALSQDQSSPLNKFYYTNTTLGVDSTITIDHPASAQAAYTQYGEIKVNDSADLIVAEGDDVIPDVLGLAEFGTIGGGPSAGRMRVNTITNAAANGAPTVSNGLIISGVTTTSDIKVGTGVTLNVYGGATYSGIITATSFRGDGSQLTGISVDTTKIETGNTKVETIDTGSDGHIKVTTEGSERLRITSDGKVGLGRNDPAFALDIKRAGYSTLRLTNSSETGHGSHDVRIVGGGSNYQNIYFEGSAFKFNTYNGSSVGERLRIDSDGNTTFHSTGHIVLPSGTTAQRVNTTGALRFNSSLGNLEFYDGSSWKRVRLLEAAPTSGLLAYWPFSTSSRSGSTYNDASGNGQHLTVNGTITDDTTETKFAGCIDFGTADGNHYLKSSSNSFTDIDASSGFTGLSISVWVKTSGIQNQWIISEGTVNTRWAFFNESANAPKWRSTSGYDIIQTGSILTGNWHHLVVTYNHSNRLVQHYRDGSFINSGTVGAQAGFNGEYLLVGQHSTLTGDANSYRWRGKMAHMRLYNRVLTSSEVSTLYQQW